MIDLFKVQQDLKFANEAFASFCQLPDERQWVYFIDHLENSLTKLNKLTEGNKLNNEVQKVFKLKKKDSLLIYIRVSRNVIAHTAKELTKMKVVGVDDNPPFIIEAVEICHTDGTTTKVDTSKGEYFKYIYELESVIDKDKNIIPPPSEHLRKKINNPTSPQEVGSLALQFYTNLFETIKAKNI